MNAKATNRWRVPLAIVLATIALSSVALPAGAAGAVIVASASGSGNTPVAGELRTFSFTARLDADGLATGMAQVNNRMVGEMFQLSVDCLKVVGSTAIVSGVFKRHTDTHAVGLTGIFAVVDSGEASTAPDRITQVFFFEPGALRCSDLEPADASPFLVDIESGNIQVH